MSTKPGQLQVDNSIEWDTDWGNRFCGPMRNGGTVNDSSPYRKFFLVLSMAGEDFVDLCNRVLCVHLSTP